MYWGGKVIQQLRSVYKDRKFKNYCRNHDSWLMDKYNLPPLSKAELLAVQKVWPCFHINEKDLTYLKMYKYEYGFNPYFLTDYYYQFVLNKTNNYHDVYAFKNKAMYDVYFLRIPVPVVITRFIYGVVKDGKMNDISRDKEIEILLEQKRFIIKPSVETGCGKGVRIIDLEKIEYPRLYLADLLNQYGSGYVTQEIIMQHPAIAALNPTSLNTCRITTILLNGRLTSSGIIKVGKIDSEVDNWHSGYIIGLTEEGEFLEYGYDSHLNKVKKTDNGLVLGGRIVPLYTEMKELVSFLHRYYFPHLGVLGWDVCVDKDNEIRVIEVNVDYPGIAGEQFCSGTFFEDRCEEINKLIMN